MKKPKVNREEMKKEREKRKQIRLNLRIQKYGAKPKERKEKK